MNELQYNCNKKIQQLQYEYAVCSNNGNNQPFSLINQYQ